MPSGWDSCLCRPRWRPILVYPVRLGLGSCVVCTVVRSPRCRPRDVHPLADLLAGMPRRTVDGLPGIVDELSTSIVPVLYGLGQAVWSRMSRLVVTVPICFVSDGWIARSDVVVILQPVTFLEFESGLPLWVGFFIPEAIIQSGGSYSISWTYISIAVVNLVNAADIVDTVAPGTTPSRHSGVETTQGGGVPQVQPRGTETKIRERTQVHSSRGAEFESIRRLASRIEEWYRDRVPDDQPMESPANQKGILRISNVEQAVPPRYLHDPDKDEDLHSDFMAYEPSQHIYRCVGTEASPSPCN